ncbi:MAG: phytanoyl-CoA dioxygenase family protein [Flavobacteriales bacterium]|nr:phytanoyl-CoA dioxygenase family protein [Flavobacteriales bacterium]
MNSGKSEPLYYPLPSAGYQVISFLSEETVKNISAYYDLHQHAHRDRGFHSTMHQQNSDYRKKVYGFLKKKTSEITQSLFPNYEVLIANFVVKDSGMNSDVGFHADWSYVNENEYHSLNVWCPLVDTDVTNGRLNVCPGSHIDPKIYRGTPFVPFSESQKKDYDSSAVGLNMKAGEAVVYDSSLVHFSDNNRSDKQRLAIALVMIPKGAQAIHCYRDEKGIDIFEVDHYFFLTHEIGKRPTGKAHRSIASQSNRIKDYRD